MKVKRRTIFMLVTLLVICAITAVGSFNLAAQVNDTKLKIQVIKRAFSLQIPNDQRVAQAEEKTKGLMVQWAAFNKAVPDRMNPGDFLEHISNMLNNYNMLGTSVRISEVEENAEYSRLQVQLTFEGSTESVHKFLSELETKPRMVRVDRLEVVKDLGSVSAVRKSKTITTVSKLNVYLEISIFARADGKPIVP